MTKYVFDNGPLRVLVLNFYKKRFPTLWNNFDELVNQQKIFSTREVLREIEKSQNDLLEWSKTMNSSFFSIPTEDELAFVREIFTVPHFQILVSEKQRLTGYPAADPFVIASAKINKAIVVTTEKEKENSAKIPNVCKHFKIPCIDLEEFMERENWKF